MKQQKLVFLRDIWEALGRPKTFKAELGLAGTSLTGRLFELGPTRTGEDGWFTPVAAEMSRLIQEGLLEDYRALPKETPKWVPPYQQWKSQPTSTATSWHDIVRDVQSGLIDDKAEKQKERV